MYSALTLQYIIIKMTKIGKNEQCVTTMRKLKVFKNKGKNEWFQIFLRNNRFLLCQQIFKKKCWNECFWEQTVEKRTFFMKKTILLIKQFNWTIVHWENEVNRWKVNDNFENKENSILKKKMSHSRTKLKKNKNFHLFNHAYYAVMNFQNISLTGKPWES